MSDSVWTNTSAKYPYVSRETWCTRGWLLVRKTRRYAPATDNDRRVAMLLLKNSKYAASAAELRQELEVIAYGQDGPPAHAPQRP